ncbi:MAG: phage tail protein [Comamonas sp.]|jgi:hypothetical protein|uniref:phage tail tube protein n=1 Tax=Comamonas sp. TaxID=34028 RepID=UPI002819BB14|nr:phage tail tube protein [Comamonas sp.]MDR0215617.1 phage tail protein [Comamonas sp.]
MASIPLPNGAKVSLATIFSPAKDIESISNAKPAVVTSAGHDYVAGDILLMEVPGWSKIDNAVVRVGQPTADGYTLAGLNTQNAERYPVGGSSGSSRSITAWEQLPKIPTFETTGGDAKSVTTSYLDYEKDFEIFTGTNPERLNFTISYAPDSAAYEALVEAHESGEIQVVRLVLKGGAQLYYPGQLFFNKAPTTTKDNEMVNQVSLALQGEITRYAKRLP